MKRKLLLAALLAAMHPAYAQDPTVDARSLGMGGAGTASANSLNAIYKNPAALASLPDEDFTLSLPTLALRVLDADSLADNLDTLDASANQMNQAISQFQATPTSGPAAIAAGDAINNFSNSLALVSNKSLTGSLFGGTMLAIPSAKFSFALALDGHAEMGGFFNYASTDQALITTLSADLAACGANPTANSGSCSSANSQFSGGEISGLQSNFNVRGVVLKEVGITAARHFADWGEIDLGITPKFINLTSYDFATSAQSGDSNVSLDSGDKKETLFTFDLGASKSFQMEGGNLVKTGLVAKNVLGKSTTTVLNNTVKISPQLTAGVAYVGSWFTGSADLDLIKNKAVLEGLNKDAQYLRVGAELDAWGWAQFRLGYRHDLAGNYDGLPSIGVGLFHVLDLSVAAVGKKEAAVAMQLGIRF